MICDTSPAVLAALRWSPQTLCVFERMFLLGTNTWYGALHSGLFPFPFICFWLVLVTASKMIAITYYSYI